MLNMCDAEMEVFDVSQHDGKDARRRGRLSSTPLMDTQYTDRSTLRFSKKVVHLANASESFEK